MIDFDQQDGIPASGEMELFVVYDTEDNKYWSTPKGKMLWDKASYAKNAVNANPPDWMKDTVQTGILKKFKRNEKFSEQERLIVRKLVFTLQKVEDV